MTDRAELIARLKNIAAGMAQSDWGTDVDMVKEAIAALEAKPEPEYKGIPCACKVFGHSCQKCCTSVEKEPPKPLPESDQQWLAHVTVPTRVCNECYVTLEHVRSGDVIDRLKELHSQHQAEIELLRSKLALVLRENRRLSNELNDSDVELTAKDAEIAKLRSVAQGAFDVLNSVDEIREQGRREALQGVPELAIEAVADFVVVNISQHTNADFRKRAIEGVRFLRALIESAREEAARQAEPAQEKT